MSEIKNKDKKIDQYWYEKEINYGLLSERWKSNGKKQLISRLETFSIEELKSIHQILNLDPPKIIDEKHYIESIIESENALKVSLLFLFFDKYEKSILDYCNRISEIDKSQNLFINLLILFLKPSKDYLLNIFIYHNWNAASTGTIYKCNAGLPGDITQKFSEEAFAFAKKLSSKNWYMGKKKIRFIGSTDSIFIFDKQVGDRVFQTTSGHKRIKPSRYLLIKVHQQYFEIREVRSRSVKILESIKKIIETQFSLELIDESLTPTKGNLETFINRLRNTDKSDEFEIISLKAKHSKLDKGVPVEIDNFVGGSDISKAITELVDRDIIILNNLSDIDQFTVSYSKTKSNGKRKTIKILENVDGTVTLKLNNKELKDDERQDFSTLFTQRFGIGLNIPLDPTHLMATQKHVFDFLLSEEHIDNPRKFQMDAIQKLMELGIITTNNEYQLKCTNCGHKMYSHQEINYCRDCDSRTYVLKEVVQLKVSERGTRKFLQNIFAKSTKVIGWNDRVFTIKKTDFKVNEILLNNKPVFVHLNSTRVNKNILEYLVKSGLPILFVNISHIVNTSDMEEQLFEQISLSDIVINEDLCLNGIEDRLERLQAYSLDKIFRAARVSYNSLNKKISQPDKYQPKEFETDVFNILKQIFPSAYKAGGKFVPEGFVGIEYETDKKYKRVFEWDCKLAQKDTYNLDQSEIDKAWRYIRATLNSEELKNFNKQLNNYIIISNSIDPKVFQNFAAALNRKKLWHGKRNVVLFHTDALIELHKQYSQHQTDLMYKPNLFYEEFFKLLDKIDKESIYSDIDKTKISELFNIIRSKPFENRVLDAAKVEAHLIKDVD
ncbi:hypothetical protein CUJ83_08415 [Methanocella sp. CWC-04]|uniref:Uncharacterized protein n=1 Tax=Methanooceanicella nereidis TaxID=2052831 RepID=A0AAP2W659_9EURY|nr:hypothetical protein [Methanocella sp. CWC-04]MCD1295018.1 hypothetical protein [Methanocella sp. CWC-04]